MENQDLSAALYQDLLSALQQNYGEITERNTEIFNKDDYVYGDGLRRSINVPLGHDITPVNWLKRVVEIHKTQFMGRPFHIISTFDAVDIDDAADEQSKERLKIENKRRKTLAELRKQTIEDIISDNGGHALFMEGAESASVAGSFIIKGYYDEDAKKYVLAPVEAVENCYVVWNSDNFRDYDVFAYVYQISKLSAIEDYGASEDVVTSVAGQPLVPFSSLTPDAQQQTEPMVTLIEMTGKLKGWTSKNGSITICAPGKESAFNALFVGDELNRVIDDTKKVPNYYIFPNKTERRRAWGVSDITDAAIEIVRTYIETLSDWRTVANKVNFPKFKGFNFGPDVQFPKFKSRQIQVLPLAEGQDIRQLDMGDAGAVDFKAQIEEIKEQFVRETGVAQVLLDNSGLPLNSNQALITSMKPTSDIAESKKELWSPILVKMFKDAFDTLAAYDKKTYGDLADTSETWSLKVQWPSTIQKEDPIYQQMLINRWNSRTISLQSFLEAQGESNEEIERIRDEMSDKLTAAIHANQLITVFNQDFMPVNNDPRVNVNLRGDLSPNQEANIAYKHGFNGGDGGGPFEPSMSAQGYGGLRSQENADNKNLLSGAYPNETPIQENPQGRQIATPANNTLGTQPMSQPGSGATTASPQGAINQANQNAGQ